MAHNVWQPSHFTRYERRIEKSSTRPSEIRTDAGPAFIKCLGNPEGPHALACEWIGTRVAALLGLQTLDFAILQLTDDDVPFDGGKEEAGPAFVTRLEDGEPWSGDRAEIADLGNLDDIAKLVVLDTYLLNWDRHSPGGSKLNKDNVFLSSEREPLGKPSLLAMDHTHVISQGRGIDARVGHIDKCKDSRIYGLFDAFAPHISVGNAKEAIESLSKITDSKISEILSEVPEGWSVEKSGMTALRTFLRDRRTYLLDTLYSNLSVHVGKQMEAMGDELA